MSEASSASSSSLSAGAAGTGATKESKEPKVADKEEAKEKSAIPGVLDRLEAMSQHQASLTAALSHLQQQQQATSILGKRKLAHPILSTAARCLELATAFAASNSTAEALKRASATVQETLGEMDGEPNTKFSAAAMRKKLATIPDLDVNLPDAVADAAAAVVRAFRANPPAAVAVAAQGPTSHATTTSSSSSGACFACGQTGHRKADCPARRATATPRGAPTTTAFPECATHGAAAADHNATNCRADRERTQGHLTSHLLFPRVFSFLSDPSFTHMLTGERSNVGGNGSVSEASLWRERPTKQADAVTGNPRHQLEQLRSGGPNAKPTPSRWQEDETGARTCTLRTQAHPAQHSREVAAPDRTHTHDQKAELERTMSSTNTNTSTAHTHAHTQKHTNTSLHPQPTLTHTPTITNNRPSCTTQTVRAQNADTRLTARTHSNSSPAFMCCLPPDRRVQAVLPQQLPQPRSAPSPGGATTTASGVLATTSSTVHPQSLPTTTADPIRARQRASTLTTPHPTTPPQPLTHTTHTHHKQGHPSDPQLIQVQTRPTTVVHAHACSGPLQPLALSSSSTHDRVQPAPTSTGAAPTALPNSASEARVSPGLGPGPLANDHGAATAEAHIDTRTPAANSKASDSKTTLPTKGTAARTLSVNSASTSASTIASTQTTSTTTSTPLQEMKHTPAVVFEPHALWSKANPPAARATVSLARMLAKPFTVKKKVFDPSPLACRFCSKRGHNVAFCPSLPNERHGLDVAAESWIDTFLKANENNELKAHEDRDFATRLKQARVRIEEDGKRRNAANPWASSLLARDQLRRNAGYWAAIGSSRTILSWILRGVPARFVAEPPHLIFDNHPSYYEHKAFVNEEIKQHVADGSFTPIPWDRVRICNPIQVEPKRGGKLRMCIDARFPNAFLAPPIFHLETLENNLSDLLCPNDWLTTSDLKKAYYSLPLDDEAAPYFAFQHEGKAYAPRIIIFGESLAPFSFHKTMRETVKAMRGLGMRTLNYLDDNIFAGTKEEIQHTTQFAQFLFTRLGFRFSEKANFTPAQAAEFLGLIVDCANFKFFLPPDKVKALTEDIARLQRAIRAGTPVNINELQSILGKLNAARAAIQPVGTWTRALHAVAAAPFDAIIIAPNSLAATEISFWTENLTKANGHRIRETHEQIELRTDASEMGFGGHALGIPAFGQLPTTLMGQSSTHREIWSLIQVARQLENALRGKHVKVQMDSQAAVAILNKGGSTIDKQELSSLAKEWWLWCERARVTPTFEWIPRTQNTRADQLSKTFDKAWVLTSTAKLIITSKWGSMRECNGEDAAAFLLGAAAQNRIPTLVTPRFTTIAYILTVAEALKLCICLVHPGWYAQPWWPRILSRAIDSIALPNSRLSLAHPSASHLPDWSMFASMIDFSA